MSPFHAPAFGVPELIFLARGNIDVDRDTDSSPSSSSLLFFAPNSDVVRPGVAPASIGTVSFLAPENIEKVRERNPRSGVPSSSGGGSNSSSAASRLASAD